MIDKSKRSRFINAISSLNDADFRCIYLGIKHKMECRKTRLFNDPEEVFNVVITSVLTRLEAENNPQHVGRLPGRSWPEDTDIRAFFIEAAGSELSNQLQKELNSDKVHHEEGISYLPLNDEAYKTQSQDELLKNIANGDMSHDEHAGKNFPSAEDEVLRKLIKTITNEILEDIWTHFKNDPHVLSILDGIEDEKDKEDILRASGMSNDNYLAARKRLRRAINTAGQKWNLEARLQTRRQSTPPSNRPGLSS